MNESTNEVETSSSPYIHLRDERGRLLPGQPSLGPRGRIAIKDGGKPNIATMARRAIEDNILDVIDTMVKNALAGDMTAAKTLLDRVSPQLKSIEHLGLDGSTLPSMTINKPIDVKPEIIREEKKEESKPT